MEMLLNSKKLCWRESTLSLCVFYIYAHMYMHICAYIYIVECLYTYTLCMYVWGWNICISLQRQIIAKRSLPLNTQRRTSYWSLVTFHMYSPDLNATSAALDRSFPFSLPSEFAIWPNCSSEQPSPCCCSFLVTKAEYFSLLFHHEVQE